MDDVVSAPERGDGPPPTSDPECPACGERHAREFGVKNGHTLSHCLFCGTVSVKAGAQDGLAIKTLYDHYYDRSGFEAVLAPVVAASLGQLVRSCEVYRETGRWLDVGYGQGGLLEVAESHSWSCYGTEVSPQSLAYGAGRGWVVGGGDEDAPRFPPGGFDVVTMLECIEHVTDPGGALRAASRWLRPGGLLYLTTPNASSLNRRLLGAGWSIFCPPEHLTVWSARGIALALRRSGFEVVKVRTPGFNPHDLLRSRLAGGRCAPSAGRNETGLGLNVALSKGPLRRLAKAGINLGLSAFRAGDSLKVWAVHGTTPEAT